MYKEDKIGTYLIPTHLRKNNTYLITTLSKNHVIENTQIYFYMHKILKQIDMGNFMSLDRVKMYTKIIKRSKMHLPQNTFTLYNRKTNHQIIYHLWSNSILTEKVLKMNLSLFCSIKNLSDYTASIYK